MMVTSGNLLGRKMASLNANVLSCLLVGLVLISCGCSSSSGASASSGPKNLTEPAKSDSKLPDAVSDTATQGASTAGKAATSSSTSTTPTAGETASSDSPKEPPATAARSNKVYEISFDDLNCGMQADVQFRPWMVTERVKELDGQKVQIAGYMLPDVKQKGITEFVLLRNTECKFGPAGQADHLIQVKLDKGVTAAYSIGPVQVTGRLKVNPFTGPDGNTWSIFDMSGESVKTLRR